MLQLDAVRTAAWAGYPYFHAWGDLAAADQAYLIAAYQLDQEIQTLMQHEAAETAARAAKKKRPG